MPRYTRSVAAPLSAAAADDAAAGPSAREAASCFNCGSYGHALKARDAPRPRPRVAARLPPGRRRPDPGRLKRSLTWALPLRRRQTLTRCLCASGAHAPARQCCLPVRPALRVRGGSLHAASPPCQPSSAQHARHTACGCAPSDPQRPAGAARPTGLPAAARCGGGPGGPASVLGSAARPRGRRRGRHRHAEAVRGLQRCLRDLLGGPCRQLPARSGAWPHKVGALTCLALHFAGAWLHKVGARRL